MSAEDVRPDEGQTAEVGCRSAAEAGLRSAAEAGDASAAFEMAFSSVVFGDADEAERRLQQAFRILGDHPLPGTPQGRVSRPTDDRPPSTVSKFSDTPPADGIADVIAHWDRLLHASPDPATAISYLARRSGLPFDRVNHLREVRNCCAHPSRHGWPSQQDVDTANDTARELLHRVAT